jgi:hypothetical protein
MYSNFELLYEQASYEAHDAAKIFKGKYAEVLQNAKEEVGYKAILLL